MTKQVQWTNPSVLQFAAGKDPVHAMEERARRTALEAADGGWTGPPFDPLHLAKFLGIETVPRPDLPDARTVPVGSDALRIEFNPMRPRGRLRFSIAHEIAHSFFPDCGEAIRNRGGNKSLRQDDWQLEVLCNIGAAELLMPVGSFSEQLKGAPLRISDVLELQKRFDVSIEALALRMLKLTDRQAAAFCASFSDEHQLYRLDYVVPSRMWSPAVSAGEFLPEDSVVANASAIGFTATGRDRWVGDQYFDIECVGLAPYPGSVVPRVVGFFMPSDSFEVSEQPLREVLGDALQPHGAGPRIVAHVVPDVVLPWGGRGFANALRKRHPNVWTAFHLKVKQFGRAAPLGLVVRAEIDNDTALLHMVAQHGVGPSAGPRVRYAALQECLRQLADWALEIGASVHMPPIGSGEGGGSWQLIRELIIDELVARGVDTTVYRLPGRATTTRDAVSAPLSA